MKIGIVTLFDLKNVNYGNRLQSYALNRYLNKNVECEFAKTLYFREFKDFRRTKSEPFISRVQRKVSRDFIHKNDHVPPKCLTTRRESFNDFCVSNMNIVDKPLSREDLGKQDFDVMVVGSDVVWYQWEYGIRPIKLLDFQMAKPFKKISYAASLGNDNIPSENVNELKRCLNSFSAISVREKSSVEVLRKIGINNVQHVLDPTLLLEKEEWFSLEKPVKELEKKQFIFSYLLNKTKSDRENITRIGKAMNLPIVTIPYASGQLNDADAKFGDYKLINCSLQEWIWLIHKAEYVITDSFHGAAFSANFQKRFLVTKRKETFEMNNRMIDFLQLINQLNKYVNLDSINNLMGYNWDYKSITTILEAKKADSKMFIQHELR